MTTQAATPSGVRLQTRAGDPVRVMVMDESDEYLSMTVNPEEGVYGYENEDTTITMFLENPESGTSHGVDGVLLQTRDRDPVRVVLMGADEEYLDLVVNPEEGVYGYENTQQSVTVFLESA